MKFMKKVNLVGFVVMLVTVLLSSCTEAVASTTAYHGDQNEPAYVITVPLVYKDGETYLDNGNGNLALYYNEWGWSYKGHAHSADLAHVHDNMYYSTETYIVYIMDEYGNFTADMTHGEPISCDPEDDSVIEAIAHIRLYDEDGEPNY